MYVETRVDRSSPINPDSARALETILIVYYCPMRSQYRESAPIAFATNKWSRKKTSRPREIYTIPSWCMNFACDRPTRKFHESGPISQLDDCSQDASLSSEMEIINILCIHAYISAEWNKRLEWCIGLHVAARKNATACDVLPSFPFYFLLFIRRDCVHPIGFNNVVSNATKSVHSLFRQSGDFYIRPQVRRKQNTTAAAERRDKPWSSIGARINRRSGGRGENLFCDSPATKHVSVRNVLSGCCGGYVYARGHIYKNNTTSVFARREFTASFYSTKTKKRREKRHRRIFILVSTDRSTGRPADRLTYRGQRGARCFFSSPTRTR